MIAIGVTGTDTSVGKTVVASALAAGFAAKGARVAVMKPIETGVAGSSPDRDGAQLAAAAQSKDDAALITPYVFPDAVAPMVAARRAGTHIDIGRLDGAFRNISRKRDVVIVEGAGGLLVPITQDMAFDSLFSRWRLSLVIVAANRLGTINHTALTVRAARASELVIRAVVLNDHVAAAGDASVSSNETVIRELVPEIRVVRFPWMARTGDHQALAETAERSGLLAAVSASTHPSQAAW